MLIQNVSVKYSLITCFICFPNLNQSAVFASRVQTPTLASDVRVLHFVPAPHPNHLLSTVVRHINIMFHVISEHNPGINYVSLIKVFVVTK